MDEDVDNISNVDWASMISSQHFSHNIRKKVSKLEEGILEQVLRVRDSSFLPSEQFLITAFSFGSPEDNELISFSSRLLALGYEVKIISDHNFKNDKLYSRSKKIAACLADIKPSPDVIIMPKESENYGRNPAPYFLSELTTIPTISKVTTIKAVDTENIYGTISTSDEGYQHIKISLPCILVMEDSPVSFLRMPTLKNRLESKGKKIQFVSSGEPVASTTSEKVQFERIKIQERQVRFFNTDSETTEFLLEFLTKEISE